MTDVYFELGPDSKINKFIQILVIMSKESRKAWTPEEDQAIRALVKRYGIKRWDTVSEEMKERFENVHRSANQCKERWMNCLSPKISKDNWTKEQLKYVFNLHMEMGNRWSDISDKLKVEFAKTRTDAAVKNQFYSALRRGLRRICKILHIKKGTQRINKIKPTVLSSLLQSPHDHYKQEIYETLFDCSDNDKFDEMGSKIKEAAFRDLVEGILVKIFGREEYENMSRVDQEERKSSMNNRGESMLGKNIEESFQVEDDSDDEQTPSSPNILPKEPITKMQQQNVPNGSQMREIESIPKSNTSSDNLLQTFCKFGRSDQQVERSGSRMGESYTSNTSASLQELMVESWKNQGNFPILRTPTEQEYQMMVLTEMSSLNLSKP